MWSCVVVMVMVEPVIHAAEKFFIPVVLFLCVLHASHHGNSTRVVAKQVGMSFTSHVQILIQLLSLAAQVGIWYLIEAHFQYN